MNEAAALEAVEHLPWREFLATFDWRQGEHVSVIGPTGSGKSTLMRAILERRAWVVVLGTKPKDRTLDKLVTEDGYTRIRQWPATLPWWRKPTRPDWDRRLVLWPDYRTKDDREQMAEVFDEALHAIFPAGGWTVVADEVYYLAHELGLADHLTSYWTQGRSLGLTLVGGTQRPAYVPLYMYDQATHLFLFSDNDEANLRRVGGLGGLSAARVRGIVAALPHHHVLYVNTRTRRLCRTRVE